MLLAAVRSVRSVRASELRPIPRYCNYQLAPGGGLPVGIWPGIILRRSAHIHAHVDARTHSQAQVDRYAEAYTHAHTEAVPCTDTQRHRDRHTCTKRPD